MRKVVRTCPPDKQLFRMTTLETPRKIGACNVAVWLVLISLFIGTALMKAEESNRSFQQSKVEMTFASSARRIGVNGWLKALYVLHNIGYQSVLSIYDLDGRGNPIGDPKERVKPGHNQLAIAFDPLLAKTYVMAMNGLSVWPTEETGKLGTVDRYAMEPVGVMAFNSEKQKLYVCCDREDTRNLLVYDLGGEGLPRIDDASPRHYQAGLNTVALALDARRNQLYCGNRTAAPNLYVYTLDSSGEPVGQPEAFGVGNNVDSLALDAVRRKLYVASSDCYICDLGDNGRPTRKLVNLGVKDAKALVLDAARGVIYFAENGRLQRLKLDDKGNPEGGVQTVDRLPGIEAICINEAENKLYVLYSVGRKLATYDLPEVPMKLLQVNSGERKVEDTKITIKLQATNPHWVCVSGDLERIGDPIIKLNEWVSVDGVSWSNDGGKTRAQTLNVPAVLKSGPGIKHIKVLFRASSSSDYDGVVQGETLAIELKK
jgi:hypothetical protein